MDFVSVFKFIIENFEREKIDFALIGGFALQAYGHQRSTRDIDFYILANNSEKVKEILLGRGYELLHESPYVLNFAGKSFELGRVDFLLARHDLGKRILERSHRADIIDKKFNVKVVGLEDLIGFKIQASTNKKDRYLRDAADIQYLIKEYRKRLNMEQVREYFRLFGREDELNKILKEIDDV